MNEQTLAFLVLLVAFLIFTAVIILGGLYLTGGMDRLWRVI